MMMNKKRLVFFIMLVFVAVILRFTFYKGSLWLDEFTAIDLGEKSLPNLFASLDRTQHAPPFDYMCHHIASSLHEFEHQFHLFSLFFGLASIILIYRLGKFLFDRRIGTAAAILLTIHWFPVHYSLEARMYSSFLFWTMLSSLFLFRVIQTGHIKDWLAYALSTLVYLYLHYFSIFILGVQLGLLGLEFIIRLGNPSQRKTIGKYCLLLSAAFALIFIGYLPWLSHLIHKITTTAGISAPSKFGDHLTLETLLVVLRGLTLDLNQPYLFIIPLLFFMAGLISCMNKKLYKLAIFTTIYVIFLIPFLLYFLTRSKTFFALRYFLVMLPFVILMILRGFEITAELFGKLSRRLIPDPGPRSRLVLTYLFGFFVLLLSIACVLDLPKSARYTSKHWSQIAEVVKKEFSPGDCILIAPGEEHEFKYTFYYRREPYRKVLGALPQTEEELRFMVSRFDTVWVIFPKIAKASQEVAPLLKEWFELVEEFPEAWIFKSRNLEKFRFMVSSLIIEPEWKRITTTILDSAHTRLPMDGKERSFPLEFEEEGEYALMLETIGPADSELFSLLLKGNDGTTVPVHLSADSSEHRLNGHLKVEVAGKVQLRLLEKSDESRIAALNITQTSDSVLEKIPVLIRKNMKRSAHIPLVGSEIESPSGEKRRVRFPFSWTQKEVVLLDINQGEMMVSEPEMIIDLRKGKDAPAPHIQTGDVIVSVIRNKEQKIIKSSVEDGCLRFNVKLVNPHYRETIIIRAKKNIDIDTIHFSAYSFKNIHPPVDITGRIELLGYGIEPEVAPLGEPRSVTLYWRCEEPINRDLERFISFNDEYRRLFQQNQHPVSGMAKTSHWQKGQIVKEVIRVVPKRIETDKRLFNFAVAFYYRCKLGGYLKDMTTYDSFRLFDFTHLGPVEAHSDSASAFRLDKMPEPMVHVGETISEAIRWIGYDWQVKGKFLFMKNYFHCLDYTDKNLFFQFRFMHDDKTVLFAQGVPFESSFGYTMYWQKGDILRDEIVVPLRPAIQKGTYEIRCTIVDMNTRTGLWDKKLVGTVKLD